MHAIKVKNGETTEIIHFNPDLSGEVIISKTNVATTNMSISGELLKNLFLEYKSDIIEEKHDIISKSKECDCEFCSTYKKYKWAVVMECKCGCHDGDGTTGHGNLCCEIPNGLRKNNPFKELKSASYYREILNNFSNECI